MRKKKRTQTECLTADLERATIAEVSPDPEIVAERLLDLLGAEDKRLLAMALRGEPIRKIASALGISYTSAGVRLHRLKQRLHELLS